MSKICRKEGLELKKNLPGYLLMAPAVIAVLALSVYPLFRGIYLSFLNYNLVRPNDPTFPSQDTDSVIIPRVTARILMIPTVALYKKVMVIAAMAWGTAHGTRIRVLYTDLPFSFWFSASARSMAAALLR